jgi:hypothetical protein
MLQLADGTVDLAPWLGRLREGTELRLTVLQCGR